MSKVFGELAMKLILFLTALLISASTYADESENFCSLDNLPLNDEFNFRNLIDKNLQNDSSISKHINQLPKLWWPLNTNSQKPNFRTQYFISDASGKAIWQHYSYVNLDSIKSFSFATLNLNLASVYPLKYKNVKFMEQVENSEHCKSPWILEWSTNNPLSPQTNLKFRIYGELKRSDKFKPMHLEINFPDGSFVRYVPKEVHANFGISSDENLIQTYRDFEDTHQSFRELSGLKEFKLVDHCSAIRDSINNVSNLTQCLVKELKQTEAQHLSIASVHTNERNARWISRINIIPPKSSGKDKQHFSSIVDLSYNHKSFHWDNIKRESYLLRYGSTAPSYIDIDRNRVPTVGGIAGDGNWDKDSQFLNINISTKESIIELEYFKILPESKKLINSRKIELQYGIGNYLGLN
jgi:hypothetical protein